MINPLIFTNEVQAFIKKHLKDDTTKLILKGSPFKGIASQELAQQIEGKSRVEKKLPTWFNTKNIFYPPKLNLSQSSSETTADYKSSLISGAVLIDITGGFGVDDYYFSKVFKKVIHCELNKELSEIVQHNFSQLPKSGVVESHCGDSITFLNSFSGQVDWIYADPGRRSKSGEKIFRLEDSLPNILDHLDLLLSKAKEGILLKTSPLLDISLGLHQLKYVKAIHVVAVKNEVKELLWIIMPQKTSTPTIRTINFDTQSTQEFDCTIENEKVSNATYSTPLSYLYEPNAAILKAGLFNTVASNFNLYKLAKNTHLYTSEDAVYFPGRRFKIIKIVPFNKKSIKKLGIEKANVTIRNFPMSVKKIRQSYGIKDGGEIYLFFTQLENKEKVILYCNKV